MRKIMPGPGMRAIGSASVILALCLPLFLTLFLPVSVLHGQEAEIVCRENGIAVTSHPRATEAAMEIMRMGGNAVDAAVAAAFAIGVVEPHASGLGGGGGMVIHLLGEEKSYFIDYYSLAPQRVGELVNRDREKDRHTALSILVPGTVAGLTLALEQFGTLPLATVLKPAIRCAEEGFAIDETLASLVLDSAEMLGMNEATAEVFLDMGFPRMLGDTLRQPELAATLSAIAGGGAAGFYEGIVAEQIISEISAVGGVLTLEDLKNYKAKLSEPLRGTYRECEILSAGLPLAGGSVIEALNILENVDLRQMGHYTTSAATLHLMAETLKRVHSDRSALMGDPDFTYIPVNGIISKDYASSRFHQIDQFSVTPRRYRDTEVGNPVRFDKAGPGKAGAAEPRNANVDGPDDDGDFGKSTHDKWSGDIFDSFGAAKAKSAKKPRAENSGKSSRENKSGEKRSDEDSRDSSDKDDWNLEEAHTTHLSVVDAEGNAVSLTQTLGTFFGSTQMAAGVLMNCGMNNFSASGKVNNVEPGKRPRSSISPTIVLKNGVPFLVVGTPGASRITSTVVELIVNLIDFDMDVAQANNAPRFFCSKFEDFLHIEGGIAEPVRNKLERMGHSLRVHDGIDLFFGGAHIIRIDPVTGAVCGAADPRRSGTAGGD